MTSGAPIDSSGESLAVLHTRLDAHFRALRESRDEHAIGTPIFALEHGLTDAEVALMKVAVCSAVREQRIPRRNWLPFVVYAAEIGYEYSGDEYWPTFEARTPYWATHGDRGYIRDRFKDFQAAFSGAKPAGPWARQFSIICWPITHAVLPKDLQRQLARVLFDYRGALTSDLLAEPDELGRRLADSAWHASSRFQVFAQNTALLGQVAAALLGTDEESPFLLQSTVRRIVADLSVERQAQRWLHDAKSSAFRVRTSGFRPQGRDTSSGSVTRTGRSPSIADPRLFLRSEEDGWSLELELPDLSVLAGRLPHVHDELRLLRARVAGAAKPLARSWLLYPGQRLRLVEWPDSETPLVQVENGSDSVNSLLADQCRFSSGPDWLFKVREPGLAAEVRGKIVRPSQRYVLISREPVATTLSWVKQVTCATGGVWAAELEVPARLDLEAVTTLRGIGLTVIADVEIRPAGLVPASWDGEGTIEWLSGEHPLVSVRSNRSVSKCILTVDAEPRLITWPDDRDEVILKFSELEPGTHEIGVALLPDDDAAAVAEGSLALLIRSPQGRPDAGSFREGLMIISHPAGPTLSELWDGRASLEVVGPNEVRAAVSVSFRGHTRNQLAERHFEVELPLSAGGWLNAFASQIRREAEMQRIYDDAESCLISVSNAGLGTATLQCDREFASLRWAFGRDANGPTLRLINHVEDDQVSVARHDFALPAVPQRVSLEPREELRWADGGLFVASAGAISATAILPPLVRDLVELQRVFVVPHIATPPKSAEAVMGLITLAHAWATAATPGQQNPLALRGRSSVLTTITVSIAGLVAGQRWRRLEMALARGGDEVSASELESAVGEDGYQRTLASELSWTVRRWYELEPEQRGDEFAHVLARHARPAGVLSADHRLAEFLLRLASRPATLAAWPSDELLSQIDRVVTTPVLLRAARFVVISVQVTEDEEVDLGAWAWK